MPTDSLFQSSCWVLSTVVALRLHVAVLLRRIAHDAISRLGRQSQSDGVQSLPSAIVRLTMPNYNCGAVPCFYGRCKWRIGTSHTRPHFRAGQPLM